MYSFPHMKGLDAANALRLLRLLRSLADAGHTVVCTLHQPSVPMLRLCSCLLLLSRGRLVYVASPEHLKNYFYALEMPVPVRHNAADFASMFVSHTDLILVHST